jgi:two-component system sensor kinase
MKITEIDMESLANNSFNEFQEEIKGRDLKFKIDNLPHAYGDRALLSQVFQNLIGNAIKFTRNKNPGVIEVGAIEEDNENIYYVRDNGAGFDMKYINKLFGLFQRLHSPEEFEGTGVGLSIVQRIIKRHGGHVWGEGEVDGGATIYFTLPTEKD